MDSLHYILFQDVKDATSAYEYLKAKGFSLTLAPTPRKASKCCGVCILSKDKREFEKIKELIEEEKIPTAPSMKQKTTSIPIEINFAKTKQRNSSENLCFFNGIYHI